MKILKSNTKKVLISIVFVLTLAISFNNPYNFSTEEEKANNENITDLKGLRQSSGSVLICSAINSQYSPEICSDGEGGAIMAWEDTRAGSYDIYAQRVDSAGNIKWAPNGVPICTASDWQYDHKICSDGAGGAIITWKDERSEGSTGDIYAQRVNSSGYLKWNGNGTVICTEIDDQSYPEITSDGAGGAIITWRDKRSGGPTGDIYAQKVNSSGEIKWTGNGTAIYTGISLFLYMSFSICSDGSGGAIIALGYPDIYAQRIDSSGGVLWGAGGAPICTAFDWQYSPKVCIDGSGGAIISWTDHRGGLFDDIYAQRVNSNGVRQWTPSNGVPICTASNDQSITDICSNGTGGAIITWRDLRTLANGYDVYAQLIDINGVRQWTPSNGLPICTEIDDQEGAQICNDTFGNVIITWRDYRGGSDWDIYAQRINSTGSALWGTNGIPICTANYNQGGSYICSDGGEGAIISWGDLRSGTNSDIYAEKVNSAGIPQWISGGGGGGGGGGDDDDDKEGEAIPGYDLYLAICLIWLITIILIKKRLKSLN